MAGLAPGAPRPFNSGDGCFVEERPAGRLDHLDRSDRAVGRNGHLQRGGPGPASGACSARKPKRAFHAFHDGGEERIISAAVDDSADCSCRGAGLFRARSGRALRRLRSGRPLARMLIRCGRGRLRALRALELLRDVGRWNLLGLPGAFASGGFCAESAAAFAFTFACAFGFCSACSLSLRACAALAEVFTGSSAESESDFGAPSSASRLGISFGFSVTLSVAP